MSSRSEQGEEKSEGFCLDGELKSLGVEDLYNLVQNLISKNPEVHRLILEWFKEKAEASSVAEFFFEICETKEEWEYLVEKLAKRPSYWRKKLIMNIQKDYLCDEKAYLEMRMENLHYGMDYWDLVEFYVNKGDLQKALETAEHGILKGEGRLTELFQFLFEHFAEERDTPNVERIVRVALTRKSEEKNMLDRLFEYYKAEGNYEKAKEALLKAYKIMRYGNYYAEYKKMKNDFDEFAAKLEEDFPEKIIEYYWQSTYRNIPGGNRGTYRIAAGYLAKVKRIYVNLLKDESGWKKRFSELKVEFKNRPAFLDEVRKL